MLEDHLSPEKYSKGNKDFRKESIAVPRINANPERDFRILDTLMELKSEGLDIVNVGMIVFSRNNTSKWQNSLSKGDIAKVIMFARDSKNKQKQHYFQRKVANHQAKAEKVQKNSMEQKSIKEVALITEKEKLTHEIEEIGDLWFGEKAKETLSFLKLKNKN